MFIGRIKEVNKKNKEILEERHSETVQVRERNFVSI